MSELVRDRVIVQGPPGAVWAIIEDPAALARVLPGAESVESTGPGGFRGVLAARIQFLTIRADVEATLSDADPPRHLRLQLRGRLRGLAGSFEVSIPFDLREVEAPAGPAPAGATPAGPTPAGPTNATEISYAVDLMVTGRLASFGAPLLRDTLRRQVATLVQNLDRELAARNAAPSS
jgi:2-furoyl-CoA dehydrogenase large subunit